MAAKDNRLIGNIYRIGQVISASSILTTYTAYNRNTNDVVGLSVLDFPPATPPQVVQQHLSPLEQRRTLQSPHILRIHDWGGEGSRLYIATDPPRGLPLRYVLEQENIDLQRALEIIIQLTRGVQTFHEHGLYALDLRPQLITIDTIGSTDRAQIDDLGLRTLLLTLGYTQSEQNTDINYLDPRYAPPEYINSEPTGPWSDLYQLGLLFFELIAGRPPFVGQNHAETGIMQSTTPTPRLKQFSHQTPDTFQALLEHALEKEPTQRFGSAAELLQALERLQSAYPRRSTSAGLTEEYQAADIALQSTRIDGEPELLEPAAGVRGEQLEPEEVYAYLVYEQDGKALQRFPITLTNSVLGRLDPKRGLNPDIDLTTLDPKMTVSRQHARIRFEKTFFYIEDLKSRNKTRLGELPLVPLKAELLQHGDTIQIGSVRLKFEVPGMSQPYVFKTRK